MADSCCECFCSASPLFTSLSSDNSNMIFSRKSLYVFALNPGSINGVIVSTSTSRAHVAPVANKSLLPSGHSWAQDSVQSWPRKCLWLETGWSSCGRSPVSPLVLIHHPWKGILELPGIILRKEPATELQAREEARATVQEVHPYDTTQSVNPRHDWTFPEREPTDSFVKAIRVGLVIPVTKEALTCICPLICPE